MAVFRVERTGDYTVMSNFHLKDKRLSLKAKGLLSQMLSLPDDWDYTLSGLSYINRESKDAIRSAVNELETAGYIRRRQTTDASGKFAANEYTIFERPIEGEPMLDKPLSENPITVNPSAVNPLPENPTQLNTKKSNTQKQNTHGSNTDSIPFRETAAVIWSNKCSSPNPSSNADFAALYSSALPTYSSFLSLENASILSALRCS